MVLPAPVGPDDRDRLPGLGDQRQVLDQRLVRVVAEGDVLELDPAAPVGGRAGVRRRRGSARRRRAARRPARPRRRPDCSRLAIEATWVSGWVNWREYWMNAWTSPRLIEPVATRRPPTTAIDHVVEVPDEHHRRHDQPGDELRAEAGLVQLLVLAPRTSASTSRWRPNTLTSSWPVNASSMCALSAPVCFHCATNCFCERLAIRVVTSIESGIGDQRDQRQQRRDRRTSSPSTPTTVSSEVSSWLSVCCRRLRRRCRCRW